MKEVRQGPRSSRMRSGCTHNSAESYVERFTETPCSEKLVTTHKVSQRTRGDLAPDRITPILHSPRASLTTCRKAR